jgi:hypothetical protein
LQLTHCVWVGHPPKHQMSWLDIFQSNFSVTPFYCFGLIFIDVLYSLQSGPFYRSLKGVNPVDLDAVVLWIHTTLISSSGHFPLGWLKISFIIPVIIIPFALSTNPFDSRCLTDAKWILVPIWSQKSLNASASYCIPLSMVIAFGTPKRQTIFCQKNFWTVTEVIVAKGFTSIHLEKYSTATTTYFKLPCAGGSGPNKSKHYLCNGQVGCIS